MKTTIKVRRVNNMLEYFIVIPKSALDVVELQPNDEIELDIPMTGGGIVIHKVSQRTGEEVV